MRQSTLALICGLVLFVVLAYSWCGRNPPPQTGGLLTTPTPTPSGAPPTSATPTATASPSASVAQPTATPTPVALPPEFRKVAQKANPAIIEVTVFDATGKLLRATNGFFVSRDGLFVTTWATVADGAYAVAKSPDGKIRNVTGVVASSQETDLAILRAETKTGVPFLPLEKTSESIAVNAWAVVIGSSLQHKEQPIAGGMITSRGADPKKDMFEIGGPIPNDATGAPVVDVDGEVVGIVTTGGKNAIHPSGLLEPMLSQIKPGTTGRWTAAPIESSSPTATPDNKRLKVTYNPAPKYPAAARYGFGGGARGSGRFRITFNPAGQVKNVQILQSTGSSELDSAAVEGLRTWKSEPGHEWGVIVPVTFEP
ncbi:MAG TPA: TonB family protein [Chthoniobacterales bacterium]|nr:TonB family protein [Chthoniobacterales bacterium]